MNKIVAIFTVLVALSACDTAKMKVKNSLTERGFVATRDYEIGQVLHWLPAQEQLLPLDVIDKTPRSTKNPANLKVGFKTGVEFGGGIKLTDVQKADLTTEVTSRASTVLENAVTQSLGSVVNTIKNDWNARPQIWRDELGISDNGWPADGAPIYVALVYRQTLADKLQVQVDQSAAVGGEFTSSVRNVNGNVKFQLEDAASLELVGQNGRTAVFYELAVVRIRNSADGPKFSSNSVPTDVRDKLISYITQ